MQINLEQPHIQLAIMSRWYIVSRALHTVAKLGLANHMSLQAIDIHELANCTNTNPKLLDRLLKFLSAYQIFRHENNAYALTKLSMPLRNDDPNSIADVLCMVDDSWWKAFSSLDEGLKSEQSAFHLEHGDDFFSYLSKHPAKQANFDKGMAKLSTFDDQALAKAYPFSNFKSLVDLGGGRGGLIKAIAKAHPSLALQLFDTTAVINQLEQQNFPSQVKLIAGDFLSIIPQADAYIFKGVLHDFSDDLMHQILSNCYQQLSPNATLFIAEQVMPDEEGPHPNKTMDIVMMALLNGRQRTLSEWQKSIEPCGFVYQNSYQTDTLFTLMAFKPQQ